MHSPSMRICCVYLLLGLSITTCACAGRGGSGIPDIQVTDTPAGSTAQAASPAVTVTEPSSTIAPAVSQAVGSENTPAGDDSAAAGEEDLPAGAAAHGTADEAAADAPLQDEGEPEKPPFDRFVDGVKTGNPDHIVGVYVENVLALRVIQQPEGQPDFVSPTRGIATQFLLAYEVNGNIGLLAHNYLSGELFFDLRPGQVVELIYGDGWVDEYEIGTMHEYQVVNPLSVSSDFIDLETGERINVATLFNIIYGGEHHLVFQTCIDRDGNDSWGRLFVIAPPY